MKDFLAVIAVTLGYIGLWYHVGWEVALSIWAIGAGYAELIVQNRVDQVTKSKNVLDS